MVLFQELLSQRHLLLIYGTPFWRNGYRKWWWERSSQRFLLSGLLLFFLTSTTTGGNHLSAQDSGSSIRWWSQFYISFSGWKGDKGGDSVLEVSRVWMWEGKTDWITPRQSGVGFLGPPVPGKFHLWFYWQVVHSLGLFLDLQLLFEEQGTAVARRVLLNLVCQLWPFVVWEAMLIR